MTNLETTKLNRRLRHAKALASWPGNPFVRAFGRMMVRRLTAAIANRSLTL